jgi:sugar phosphate isomerase/epimerase
MTTLKRREFLATMGAAMVAARTANADSVRRLGVQLYSVRTDLEKDFDGTLAKVAAIGYKEVEFAGYFNHTPQQVRDALKRHNLDAPSAHIDYATISDADKWNKALDDAHTIGHTYLVDPWIDESLRGDAGAWKKIADAFNAAGATAKKHGIEFAYHNHNFEFVPMKDGKLPFDVLLDSCDPSLVKMEMDLCWISAAGKDPVDYFHRYPGRFPLVHVKGLNKKPAGPYEPDAHVAPDQSLITNVGASDDVIDWTRIFARSKEAGIRHYFVEHDVPKHPFEDLKASYDYVSKLKF